MTYSIYKLVLSDGRFYIGLSTELETRISSLCREGPVGHHLTSHPGITIANICIIDEIIEDRRKAYDAKQMALQVHADNPLLLNRYKASTGSHRP